MKKRSQLLLVLFFVSGACGLIYEVVWTRLFVVVIGNTVFSVSAVLSVLMAGLALGSWLAGRRLDKTPIPLVRTYALLEAGVGVYNLLLPFLLKGADPVFGALYRVGAASFLLLSLGRLGIAFILLILPATLMGATLPILIRFYVDEIASVGTETGRLYTANTFGAAIGTAGAGFILIPLIGVNVTLAIAAVLNLAIASIAWRFAGTHDKSSIVPVLETSAAAGPVIILAAMFLSGLAALSNEVAWTRVLSLVVGPTAYAFSLMLISMIAGLGIGAAFGARLADRRHLSLSAFAWIELGVGLSSLAIVPIFGRLPIAVGQIVTRYVENFFAIQCIEGAIFFGILLIPTTLLGMTFPIASRLYARSNSLLGTEVGAVYAFNTVGGIVGSLAAGFFLIPYIGSQWTLILAAALNAAIAVLLIPPPRQWVPLGLALTMVPGIVLLPRWNPELMTSGAYKYAPYYPPRADLESILSGGELRYFKEGATTTVSVRRLRGQQMLAVDGKVDATDTGDMTTQRMLAHVPLLLDPTAKSVAIIGLGSGVTAGAALQHPIQSLDVVEISPEVVEASDLFRNVNHDPLHDPRTHLIIGDGRNHLRYTAKQYDVIISEPSNPWMSGMASLFTKEFFDEARSRLTPNGIHCQWFHSYNMALDDLRTIVATFRASFPHAQLWALNSNDFLLLGSPAPIHIPPSIASTFAQSENDFKEVHIYDLYSVLSLYMLEDGDLDTFAAGARLNTDALPILEFHAPRYLYANTSYTNFDALKAVQRHVPVPPVVAETVAAATWVNHRNKGEMYLQADNFKEAIDEFQQALTGNINDAQSWNDLLASSRNALYRPEADQVIEKALNSNPTPEVRVSAAEFYSQADDYDKAADLLEAGLKSDPRNLNLLEELVDVRTLQGSPSLVSAVDRLQTVDPANLKGLYGLATERFYQQRYDEAIQILKGLLAKDPTLLRARNLLAIAYGQTFQTDLAETEFRKCISESTQDPTSFNNYGVYLLEHGRPTEAITIFRKALDLDSEDVQALVGLGEGYRQSGRASEAQHWYQTALRIDPNQTVAKQYVH